MTKQEREERVVEKAVVELLKLEDPEWAARQITDLVARGVRGWWDLCGRPDYTKRLQRIKRRLEKSGHFHKRGS